MGKKKSPSQKVGSKQTIPAGGKGQSPITFKKGGLHQSLGVPQGQPIPQSKLNAALKGSYGPKAQKQAQLAKGLKKMRPGSK